MLADPAGSMLLSVNMKKLADALFLIFFYKPLIIAAVGFLICIVITTIACIVNNKKIKRMSRKENDDAEQK